MLGLFGAVSFSDFCNNAKEIISIAGWVLYVFKIAIPLLIVFLGAFDLGKAVVSGKEDDIKKNLKVLAVRIIAGIIIFLLPSLILAILNSVDNVKDVTGDSKNFGVCYNCLLKPGDC